jgi:primosomal protein N' (replication factor Y)
MHDYKKMYAFEIENRERFFYPPFSRIIQITLKHKVKQVVDDAAHKLAERLSKEMAHAVMGPTAPVVNRIRNQYLMELMIKLPLQSNTIASFKQMIRNHFNLLQTEPQFKSLTMVADVDAC